MWNLFSKRINQWSLLIGNVRACIGSLFGDPTHIFLQRLSCGEKQHKSAWLQNQTSLCNLSISVERNNLLSSLFILVPHVKLHPSYGGICKSSSCLGLSGGGSPVSVTLNHLLRNTSWELWGLLMWQVGGFSYHLRLLCEPQQVFHERIFLHRLSLNCFYNNFRWHTFKKWFIQWRIFTTQVFCFRATRVQCATYWRNTADFHLYNWY